MPKITKSDLLQKLEALGDLDEHRRNAIVCGLIGHSKIQRYFLGYYSCARCGASLGDAIGGCYDGSNVVIVGHDCYKCHDNYKKLTWRDKIFCPDPFEKEGAENEKE